VWRRTGTVSGGNVGDGWTGVADEPGATVVTGVVTAGGATDPDEPEARLARKAENAPTNTTPTAANARVVDEILRMPTSRSSDLDGDTPRPPNRWLRISPKATGAR
jgi:hypothetical protein